jgi:hypothetical protein
MYIFIHSFRNKEIINEAYQAIPLSVRKMKNSFIFGYDRRE